MMQKTFLVILFWGLTFASFAQTKEELLNQWASLVEQEKFEQAIEISNLSIQKFPDEPTFYLNRGIIISDMPRKLPKAIYMDEDKNYALALKDFLKVIEIDSTINDSYIHLGNLHLMYKKPELGIKYYSKAIKLLDPIEDKEALTHCIDNRASLRLFMQQIDQAIEDYKYIIKIDSRDAGAYNNLAMSYIKKKDYAKAYKVLDNALIIDENFVPSLSNYAYIYTLDGKYKEAVEIYDKLLKKEYVVSEYGNKGYFYNNRGYAKLQLGKVKDALKDINQSLEYYPNNSYAFRNRALVYLKMNQKDLACTDLQKAEEYQFSRLYGDEVQKLLKEHCEK